VVRVMLVDPRITTRRSCEMEFGEYGGLMNKIGVIVSRQCLYVIWWLSCLEIRRDEFNQSLTT